MIICHIWWQIRVIRYIIIKLQRNTKFFIIVDEKHINEHKNVILIKAITFNGLD